MEKEVSCINSRNVIEYLIAQNCNYADLMEGLDPEIDGLDDPEAFLKDANNWISSEVFSRLLRRAKERLNDERFPYKLGKYTVENASLGYGQRIIVKAFWSSQKGLKNLQKINDRWNRNKRVELVRIKGNEAIVRLHWNPNMGVSKDICDLNQGTYTYMPMIWGGRPMTLTEACCFFDGNPYCEYHLKWPVRNRLHEFLSRFFTSKTVLEETIKEMENDKKVIELKYEEVARLNLALNNRIKQLLAIHETGKAILSILDLDQLLTVIMNLLSSACQINRAIIMLLNEKEKCLEYVHGVGFDGTVPEPVKTYKVPLNRLSNILARVASTGVSEYVPDVRTSSLRKDNIVLTYGKPSSVHVVPLITRSKVIGVIATDAVDKIGVPVETRETLEIFAPQIAIAIENARLYKKLQEQMDELKRSHALLSRAEKFSFLGNLAARLAHEIKNPLTAIGTFIQMLPHKYNNEEFRQDFYKIAMEETNRVNNLITELLDLVKKKESHFELSDLHGLINKMVLLVSPQSKAKKIGISHQFDPDIGQIWLDAEKMKQVVLNILSNAIDWTPERGKIEIVTNRKLDKEGNGQICIEIKDTGIGISESNLNRIFDPYFTTRHRSDMHNGTGLGLFIAYQNIQDHGGTIEVKSAPDEGTNFILTLPLDKKPVLVEEASIINR